MECDIYARIECKTDEQYKFFLIMLEPRYETVMEMPAESKPDVKVFELFEASNKPQGFTYKKSSRLVQLHWHYGDTLEAKKQLGRLAKGSFETCYALLWFDIGEFVLLCARDAETTFHTEKWHGETWHKLNHQQYDVFDILADIAKAGGVFVKGEKPLTAEQLGSFTSLLRQYGYQVALDDEVETVNDLLISCWQDENKHCYYVPMDDFDLGDVGQVRKQYEAVLNGLINAAGLSENTVSVCWNDSNWEEGELSINLIIGENTTKIDWTQEDEWVDGSFVLPVTTHIQVVSLGEFVDIDDGYGFDHRLMYLVHAVAEEYKLIA